MVVDPFTVAQTVSAVAGLTQEAWKLGNALHKLYKDAQTINEAVKNLAAEVKGLGNACDLVYQELQPIVVSTSKSGNAFAYDQDGSLWSCIDAEITECGNTLLDIRSIIAKVGPEGTSTLAQARRQIMLNQQKGEIAGIRERLRTHTDSLNTVLLTVSIKVAHVSPQLAAQELGVKLDDLRCMIEKLRQQPDSSLQHQAHPGVRAALVQYATDVIVSGSTLYEASIAGGSICGGFNAASSNAHVADWMRACESLRHDMQGSEPSECSSNVPTIFTRDGRDAFAFADGNDEYDPVTTSSSSHVDDVDDDSDDELGTDIAKEAMRAAKQAFDSQEWNEADSLLQETVTLIQDLPLKRRAICDIFDIQYMLAVCTYHMGEPAAAELALVNLIEQPPVSDQHRGAICEAGYFLSRTYISLGKLDLARSSCESSLKGRARLMGKEHESYYQSLALMARVFSLLDMSARARLYLALIPEAMRPGLVAATESMSPTLPSRPPPLEVGSTVTTHSTGGHLEQNDEFQPERSNVSSRQSDDVHEDTGFDGGPRMFRPRIESEPVLASNPIVGDARRASSAYSYRAQSAAAQTGTSFTTIEPGVTSSSGNQGGDGIYPCIPTPSRPNSTRMLSLSPRTRPMQDRNSLSGKEPAEQVTKMRLGSQATLSLTPRVDCWPLKILFDRKWLRSVSYQDPHEVVSALRRLREGGWDANQRDVSTDGSGPRTPLACAVSLPSGRRDLRSAIVSFLLQEGANVLEGTNQEGPIALHLAIRNDAADIVSLLLQTRPEEQLSAIWDCDDPLYAAVKRALAVTVQPLDIVRILLEAGADVCACHLEFKSRPFRANKIVTSTPLSYATEYSPPRQDLVKLLMQYQRVGDRRDSVRMSSLSNRNTL